MPSSLPAPGAYSDNPGCRKYQEQCIICKQHLVETATFSSSTTQEKFTIRQDVSCTSSNIVYLLFCDMCAQSQYVGETKNTLKTRFYLHRSHISRNQGTHVTRHFQKENHSLANMKCLVIETVFAKDVTSRRRRERFWIEKLQTVHPRGLNTLESS